MRKFLAVSLVASSFLMGATIELHQGWNLVGISGNAIDMNVLDKIKDKNISLIVTNDNGAWLKFNPNISYLQQFSTFTPGKAYWIKADQDVNLSFNYINSITFPVLKAGWNLVSFGENSNINEIISQLNNNGLKLDLIVTNDNGAWLKFNPNISYLQQFSTLDNTKGYWVKVEKLAAVATTKDGYDVKLYVDKENTDVSNLVSLIANYNLSELPLIKDQLTPVSNIVLSSTKNGSEIDSSYISPESLTSDVINNFQQQVNNPTATQNGIAVYVYGISEGGSPFIISNAKVYKVNADGSKGDYLGETSQTGYIFLNNLQDGDKIWVEKDGFLYNVQTVKSISGSANYVFLTQTNVDLANNSVLSSDTTSTTNARLLNKVLYGWDPVKSTDGVGHGYFIPANIRHKRGEHLILVPVHSLASLFESEDLQNKIFENGYNSKVLSILAAVTSTSQGIKTDVPFSDIFEVNTNYINTVSLNDIQAVLGFNLDNFPEIKESLLDNNGNIDPNKINDVKQYITVYKYTSNGWEEVNPNDVSLIIDGINSNDASIQDIYHSNPQDNAAIVVKNLGSATLLVASYKQPVNSTPSVTYNTYGLNVKVVDENNQPLVNALVKMSRGHGGTEVMNYTDSNGIAHFDVLAADGAIGTISLNAIDGDHYPVSKVLNISSLIPDQNTTITLQMQAPPSYATVKGKVTDADTNTSIANAKVNLIYPIALATVKKDVTKIINDEEVKGIEVGLVPNARYKWYIKAHSDTENTNALNGRVSTQRWILVKEATAANGGNFLAYNKIIAQALAAPLSSDPADVTVIPTGQFDIAVEVDHDIDGDGNYDFVELAATDANQSNLPGEEFSNANNNYGKILGFISTSVDIKKLIEDNAGALDSGDNVLYADLNGSGFVKYGTVSDLGNLDDYTLASSDDATLGSYIVGDNIKINFSNNGRYILISDDTHHTSDHKIINTIWKAGISATITDVNGTEHYIALKKVGNDYEWVERSNPGINADGSDDDYLTDIKSGEFSGIEYDKIGQFIAQNKIFKKLAEKLSEIKTEIGANWTPQNADNSLVKDGFTLSIVPELEFNITANTTNVPVGTTFKVRKEATIALGGNNNNLRDYIKLDQVMVDRPVLTQPTQTVHTDVAGLYQFSAVPLSYGELNAQESLLRVESAKLGYYDSPVVNVPKFTEDNTATSVREDVQTVDLSMQKKPLYNVEVNVTDANGNPINNAVVIMDGIKTDNTDLTEDESLKALQGSDVVFNNVIGGRGSNRIVRVSVPNSNYVPVIKTIRNLNSDEIVNVKLLTTSQIADFPAQITILDSSVNPRTGVANITLNIVDKEDGTTTVTQNNIYVTDNGEIVSSTINQNGTTFTISVPLKVGQNNINIEVTNTQGISKSNTILLNYNPNVGSIAGKIYGITDENGDGKVDSDRVLVLDIFNSEGQYINTAMPSIDGRYILQNLEAGKTYEIQALELDAQTNRVVKKSNVVDVTVLGGQVFNQDLTLQTLPSTIITGAPVVDFIGDLTQEPISINGEINVSFTVSNFDLNNGAKAAVVVNGVAHEVNSSQFNSDGNNDNSYNVQNFAVQLKPGQNVIYITAKNPDGSFENSPDVLVNWEVNNSIANVGTLDINVMDANNDPIPSSVELVNNDGVLINSGNTDNNGKVEFLNVVSGNYHLEVYPLVSGYSSKEENLTINNGINEINITLPEISDTINVPDYYISSIDLNSSYLIKDEPFKATVNLVVSDEDFNISTLNYNWYYIKDYNTTYVNCHTESCEFNLTQSGSYILGVEVGDQNYSTNIYVNSVEIDTPPTVDTNASDILLPPAPGNNQ